MYSTAVITTNCIITNTMYSIAVITTNCTITNNVSIYSHDIKDMQLAVGVPSLRETVAGLELQLPPVKNLWNTIHGAQMLCQALEELLAPSKKTTVLDIGCGIGVLGLYLSKVCVVCSICLCLFVCFYLSKYCRGKVRVVSIYRLVLLFLLYNNNNKNYYYNYHQHHSCCCYYYYHDT